MANNNSTFTLRRSLAFITISGCLSMLYATTTQSPATIEFFRRLGANEFHFGLIGAVPLVMLFMQFLGALMTARVRERKRLFLVMAICSRLLYIPLAFVPMLFPSLRANTTIFILILLLALNQGMANLVLPMWFSWMGDLIPQVVLNRFWGERHRWVQLTWMICYVLIGAVTYFVNLPITLVYPILVMVGCAAGVTDALLFIWVLEPANPVARRQGILEMLLAPLRHGQYRNFVVFSCIWSAAVTFASSFMQLFLLKMLNIGVWQTVLMWSAYGPGSVLTARVWGKAADRFGNAPVLKVCLHFKPIIVLVYLFINAKTALFILPTVFFFDGILNTGLAIASNGYMLKIAPRENRSMYIAAITGLAGICGGLATLAAGSFLQSLSGFSFAALGKDWNNYHLLFALGVLLRVACIPAAYMVHEPNSATPGHVIGYLKDVWRVRLLAFPARRHPRYGR